MANFVLQLYYCFYSSSSVKLQNWTALFYIMCVCTLTQSLKVNVVFANVPYCVPWRRHRQTCQGFSGKYDLEAGTSRLSLSGFMRPTWNMGWIFQDLGSLRRTATGLITFGIGDRPINLGDNLCDSTRNGRSVAESQTRAGWWDRARTRCQFVNLLYQGVVLRSF